MHAKDAKKEQNHSFLSSPGIEPGCSAPQAEILTTVWTRPTATSTLYIYDLYV